MSAILLAALWFQAVQYAPRPAALRGCSECQGEKDDVCEVRAGAQVEPLESYAKQRWPLPGRVRLLRPSAEAGCAVPAKSLFGARAPVELAAVRLSDTAPAAALLESLQLRPAIRGWPRRPSRRADDAVVAAKPDRAALRLAVICWPSDKGWPMQAGSSDARALGPANSCEWWLLPVTAAAEPDLAGASFAVAEPAFAAFAARWAKAFDRDVPLEQSRAPAPVAAPAAPIAPAAPAAPARCGEIARERTATLDRFDQWDLQIRRARQPSLDRATLTLQSAWWAGHCQELDVLRAELERQLDCKLAQEGKCE